MMKLEFFVQGEPKTQGSKTAIYNPKANKTIVKNANEKTGSWRSDVRNEAQKAVKRSGWKIPERQTGINIEIAFFFKRPASHYNTKGFVKDSSPENHTTRPDVVKCARAVEDALIGLVYEDDSQICHESLTKNYTGTTEGQGVWVRVTTR